MTETRLSPDPAYRPSPLMNLMLAMGTNLEIGRLDVTLPDGSTRMFGGKLPGPVADLTIHRDRLARRFLTAGNLGFNEAYLDGDWSSRDVEALFVFFLTNRAAIEDAMLGKSWYRWWQWVSHKLKRNSRKGSKKNIAHHYDLGNHFYKQWLDPTMTYSSALFEDSNETCLSTAQHKKYAAMAQRMGLAPDHHVLEIGCGWGGFAEFAAKDVGARVTAITISQEQFAFARERMHREGLAEKVDIQLRDYRDLDGRYDGIASIEMFEAVGEPYWPTFFGTLRERLAPSGRAALQIITIADRYFDDYRRSSDYIQKYIFPGGMLPSPTALEQEITRAGLHLREMVAFGQSYARTLRDWNTRFQTAWPEIEAMGFDPRFKRMWEQYLAYCAAGFQTGSIDVVQVAVARD